MSESELGLLPVLWENVRIGRNEPNCLPTTRSSNASYDPGPRG